MLNEPVGIAIIKTASHYVSKPASPFFFGHVGGFADNADDADDADRNCICKGGSGRGKRGEWGSLCIFIGIKNS